LALAAQPLSQAARPRLRRPRGNTKRRSDRRPRAIREDPSHRPTPGSREDHCQSRPRLLHPQGGAVWLALL